MRLLLSYFDQNEEFARELPRQGTVERFVRSNHGSEWALLRLDRAIEYRGRIYSQVLIRSRWDGFPLGGKQATSVHIVLVSNEAHLDDGFVVDPTNHVAWGMTESVPEI